MQIFELLLTAIGLGAGLAMDAFSVSLANGLAEPCGTRRRAAVIAGVFAVFQALMPMTGWVLVTFLADLFTAFQRLIPFIALALLVFIGSKMIFEGARTKCEDDVCSCARPAAFATLLVQGVATSIDALSVGLSIAEYSILEALFAAAVIAVVTFALCFAGVRIGRKFGTKFAGKATILGGVILIIVGISIFLKGILG